MDDLVVVDSVQTVVEASVVCGLLRDAGIECYDRPTNFAVGAADGWASGGPREIVVRGDDAGEARRVLEAQRRGT
jgi:Putative prokaryotic signal transducing protein